MPRATSSDRPPRARTAESAAALRERALALHRAGDFAPAEAAYQALLRLEPANADVLHMLGMIAAQTGETARAVTLLERALRLNPDMPGAHCTLGTVLMHLERADDALQHYDRAVALQPGYVDALRNRAVVLAMLGRHEAALASHDEVLRHAPGASAAHLGRGDVLLELGRFAEALDSYDAGVRLAPADAGALGRRAAVLICLDRHAEALDSYDRALALQPDDAPLHSNRAALLLMMERPAEALAAAERAIELDARLFDAHCNRATALRSLKRPAEALASCERAIELRPDYPDAYACRGAVQQDLDRPEEALASNEQALRLCPDHAGAHFNRAVTLLSLGRLDEALAAGREARRLEPGHADAGFNEAACLLLLGRLQEGFTAYEWRKRRRDRTGARQYPQPEWLGAESLAGATLFVHAEQGFGDSIQFCRYLSRVEALAARVVFAAPRALHALLRGLGTSAEIIGEDETPSHFDFHCALLSLPLALGTSLETVPHAERYLQADPARIATWSRRLAPGGLRVGIAWQGTPGPVDAGRSFPVAALQRLAALPGVRLISLQKNAGVEQLQHLPAGMRVETLDDDFDAGPEAFVDTAAVIENLDLVITSDTAIAHLAGALGREAWVALKDVPDWRWLMAGERNPWYPSLRLFRQPRRGDWDAVFAAMHDALAARVPAAPAIGHDDLRSLFGRAVALHQRGEFPAAEAVYETMLGIKPDDFNALHMLGVLASQTGRGERGVELLRRAIALRGHVADAHGSLGTALLHQRQLEEAVASFDRALELDPRLAQVHSNRGIALVALGRQEEALASFDRAVALDPGHVEAWSNRAAALRDLRRTPEALASAERALQLQPDCAQALSNRGGALHALERNAEALTSLDRAVALQPNFPDAHNLRGVVLRALKRLPEALESLQLSLDQRPDWPEGHANRGTVLMELQRPAEALAAFDRALELRPDYPEAWNNRAAPLRELRRFDEALASCEQALRLRPAYAAAQVTRAVVLYDLQRVAEGLASADAALALDPDMAEAHNSRGVALTELGHLDEALASFARALALRPAYAEALSNRGVALRALGDLPAAIDSTSRALALQPDYAEAAFNESIFRLLAGDFEHGWPLYESRKRRGKRSGDRTFPQPLWLGTEDLRGRVLFVHWEQGLGDTLQFCRYARLAEARGATVVLSVQKPLRALLRQLSPSIQILVDQQAPVEFDLHCPLLSLPLAFGTDGDSIPAETPYLYAEPARVAHWQQRIGEHGFRIGIAWQGSTGAVDAGRSFPVSQLAPLASIPGVRLISLQKNQGSEQLAALPAGMEVQTLGPDFDTGAGAFLDSAAVMANLDLVITSDTAIAHLAGALGCPTWVALKHMPDWRWLTGRDDSPWYPAHRLFRQAVPGDWPGVFAAMASALPAVMARARPRTPPIDPTGAAESHALRDQALAAHQRGELGAAERDYRSLRERLPADFDAVHMLGVLCGQLGRRDEAEALLEQALALRPRSAAALGNLGTLRLRLGQPEQAVSILERALALRPADAQAHSNLGIALATLQRRDEALACFDAAIRLKDTHVEAHSNRSAVLRELGRFDEALASADEALRLEPRHVDGHNNRAAALLDLQRPAAALESLDRSLAIRPDQPAALNSRGLARLHGGQPAAAIADFDAALAAAPDYAQALVNRAAALFELDRLDAAIADCDRALALAPDHPDAHVSKGIFHLQAGDYGTGLPHYEWRRQAAQAAGHADLAQPLWLGAEDLRGKTLLVHAEQGLGDNLQFCRYALLAEARGARVVLLVPRPLVALLRTLSPTIGVVADDVAAAPPFDLHCPMLSLPHAFGTNVDTIPARVPYLAPEPARVAAWRQRLPAGGLRIGIAWQGSFGKADAGRSFPLGLLHPLALLPGVRLISLQKGVGQAQLADLPAGMSVHTLGPEFDAGPDAFLDTAAVMASLDLVITCDTSVAHLAGALGRPTWVALKQVADWRWLRGRADSPWYPTMTLFRQPRRGDWAAVFDAMRQSLVRLLATAGQEGAPDR